MNVKYQWEGARLSNKLSWGVTIDLCHMSSNGKLDLAFLLIFLALEAKINFLKYNHFQSDPTKPKRK